MLRLTRLCLSFDVSSFPCCSSSRHMSDLLKAEGRAKRAQLKKDAESDGYYQRFDSAFHRARRANTDVETFRRKIETVAAPQTKGEILFGIHSVHEALRSNRRQLHRLFVKTNQLQLSDDEPSSDDRSRLVASVLRLAKERSVSIRPSSASTLDKLCSNQMHNGFCLDASPLNFTTLDQSDFANASASTVWLLLDGVLDPTNFGAIVRTAYYLGVEKLIVAEGRRPHRLSPAMSKTSAGALEFFPVCCVSSGCDFLEECSRRRFSVIGTCDPSSAHAKGRTSEPIGTFSADDRPLLVVFGHEGTGINSDLLERCEKLLHLSSNRKFESNVASLNVSVAVGITLHQLLNFRKN
uniref:rRNA methyltransferase 1, mitochondrial n=1 Tax=Plectus sambesii TaxID=2011161 RepID=A0A914WG43_9BILA